MSSKMLKCLLATTFLSVSSLMAQDATPAVPQTTQQETVDMDAAIESFSQALMQKDGAAAIAVVEKTPSLATWTDTDGRNLLMAAAYAGNVEATTYLISKNANVNARDTDGMTPVILASLAGELDIVKLLHTNKADINAQNSEGQSALHLATLRNHTAVGGYLAANGANLNATASLKQNGVDEEGDTVTRTLTGMTPLMIAAAMGNYQLAEFYVRKGADASLKNSADKTALDIAEQTNPEIAKLLTSKASHSRAATKRMGLG